MGNERMRLARTAPRTRTPFVLIALLLLIGAAVALARPTPAFAGYADIIVDAATGEVLHAKNADKINYPASLTKMMTLYLLFNAIENGKITLDQALPVSGHAAAQPATKLGLRKGSTIKVETAIFALVIQSANDVATVVAEAISGSEEAFARKMTEAGRVIGMRNTVFRNPHGLPDPAQHTTARDMAVLAIALLQDYPQYYHYFGARKFKYGSRTYTTHNRVVLNYPGADGFKTGYTRASGYNLVTSAVRDGQRLIGVVLGGSTWAKRDAQMVSLLDRSFGVDGGGDTVQVATSQGPSGIVPREKPPAPAVPLAVLNPEAGTRTETPMPAIQLPASYAASLDSTALEATIAAANPDAVWGIQVGAFSRFAPAHLAATNAAAALREVITADVAVEPSDGDSGKLYRARLVGITREEAEQACRQLQQQSAACLVVRVAEAAMGGSN